MSLALNSHRTKTKRFMIVTLIQPLNMLKLKKKAEEDETEKRTDSQREIN